MSPKLIINFKFILERIYVFRFNSIWFVLLERYIGLFQRFTATFITFHQRPQRAKSILAKSHEGHVSPKLAIIIQGPVILKKDFTIETVKLYKQLFPSAIIVLSTWEEERQEVISYFENLGVVVLLSRKPDYPGFSNINLQITSTKAGIKKAKELGVEYVVKTRTDQRMYSPNVFNFLLNIIKVFPLSTNVSNQNKRIIGLSLNTFKYRMYGLSDMFMFGHISDMITYWDVSLDNRRFHSDEIEQYNLTLRSFANWRICEVYLMTEFLTKTNRSLLWTLKDSWDVFANQFCVIDASSIDLYWGKYSFAENRWTSYSKAVNLYEEISFKEWLELYVNLPNIDVPEYLLEERL